METFFSHRSLHLSLRFVLPLSIALAMLAYLLVPLVDRLTLKWFARDLDIRSKLISSTLQDPLGELVTKKERKRVNLLLQKATQDERLLALGLCDTDNRLAYSTSAFPKQITCTPSETETKEGSHLLSLAQGPVHLFRVAIDFENSNIGTLVLVHDMSFVERRSADTRK